MNSYKLSNLSKVNILPFLLYTTVHMYFYTYYLCQAIWQYILKPCPSLLKTWACILLEQSHLFNKQRVKGMAGFSKDRCEMFSDEEFV
jgi:SPX domain protein involved in polyphosphate accumulation